MISERAVETCNLRLFNRILFSKREGKLNHAVFVVDGEKNARRVKAITSIGHIKTLNPISKELEELTIYFEDSENNIYVVRYSIKEKRVISLKSGYDTLEHDLQRKEFVGHHKVKSIEI